MKRTGWTKDLEALRFDLKALAAAVWDERGELDALQQDLLKAATALANAQRTLASEVLS